MLYNHETKEILGKDAVEGVLAYNNKTNEEIKLDVTGFCSHWP